MGLTKKKGKGPVLFENM